MEIDSANKYSPFLFYNKYQYLIAVCLVSCLSFNKPSHRQTQIMNGTTANEQLMELKLKEFELKFAEKIDDIDETFQSIVRRQNNTERLVNVQHEESVKLIEKKSRELHNGIEKTAQESIKEVEGKLESRNDVVEMAFRDISLHMDNMQAFSIKEREKLIKSWT